MGKKKIDLLLVVRGDHNDADWITKVTPITEEQIERFSPLFKAIKSFKKYKGVSDPKRHPDSTSTHTHDNNWPSGEYGYRPDLGQKSITEYYGEKEIHADLVQEFDEEYVPHAEGWNIHTIHEIFVVRYDKHLFNTGHWSELVTGEIE